MDTTPFDAAEPFNHAHNVLNSDVNATPHQMRITCHGKIRNFVKFALVFLEDNPGRSLLLHTLPVAAKQSDVATSTTQASQKNPLLEKKPSDIKKHKRKLETSTTVIPRLISVVEIIKREFILAAIRMEFTTTLKLGEKRPPPKRLFQYNSVGVMEDSVGAAQPQPISLEEALSGKSHLKIRRTPYMKIFLSVQKLSEDTIGDATYQEPIEPPNKTRAAKARERKRRRNVLYRTKAAEDPSKLSEDAPVTGNNMDLEDAPDIEG